MMSVPREVELLAPTPARWFDVARERLPELLVDHANCEKKAASTALALMFGYAGDALLAQRMSRLAREELRHFEQVEHLRQALGIGWQRLSPARYAEGLRRAARRTDPARLIDLLFCGALIEARSCERFIGLGGCLTHPVGTFYARLAVAEERHARLYLELAAERIDAAQREEAGAAWRRLATVEAELATSPDSLFRFHSGCPS